MNTNIGFYVECRHKLGKTIDEIFFECKSAFKRFDQNRFDPNKFMFKKIETRTRPIEYKFGEKIEFINFKFSSSNFQFSSATKVPEEIAFYFVSRFHSLKNLTIIKEEADKLFVNKQFTIREYESLAKIFFDKDYKIILEEELEQKTKKCNDLEILVLDKNEKLEESLKKCDQFEKQLNKCKSNEQDLINKIQESENEKKEALKNYETVIKKLHEFEDNLSKEREEKGTNLNIMQVNLNEKNNKITKLESDIKEVNECLKECENIYNKLKFEHEKIKLENDQLRLQIQNSNQSEFCTQVINNRLKTIRQQIAELEAQNKQLDQEKSSLQAEVNEHKLQSDQLNKYIKTEIENFENFKQLTNTKQNETEQIVNELEKEKSILKASLNEKVNQHDDLLLNLNLLTENNYLLNEKIKSIEVELKEADKNIKIKDETINVHLILEIDFEKIIKDTNAKLNTYEQEIKVIEQEKSTLKIDISQKNKENENLSNKILSMTEKNKKLQDQVILLNQDISDQSTQIDVLLEEKNKLSESNEIKIKEILENNIKLIQDLNENHEKDFASYQTKEENLQKNLLADKNRLTESNKELQKRISMLEKSLIRIKNDPVIQNELKSLKANLNEKSLQITLLSKQNEAKIKEINKKNSKFIQDLKENHEKELASYQTREQDSKNLVENLMFKNNSLSESNKFLKSDLERAQEILKSDLNEIKELNYFKKENENEIEILKTSIFNLELELKNLNDEKILINEDSTKLREHHDNQITLFKLNEQELNSEIKRLKSENEELCETKKKFKDILSNKIKNDSAYFQAQNSIKSENKQSNIQSDSNNNYKRKLSNETINETNTKKNETKV
jgi:chromosome segregation ATPase